jgi:hypothetical protein
MVESLMLPQVRNLADAELAELFERSVKAFNWSPDNAVLGHNCLMLRQEAQRRAATHRH